MAEELRLPPEIERYYEKWRKDPHSKIFAQLADAYRKIGMLDEAIDVCLQGLKVHPSYVSARMVLARAYLEKDMDAQAEDELSGILGTDADNILACRMLADLLYKKGSLPEAVEQYQRLLKLTPLDREIKSILEKAEAKLKPSPAPLPSSPAAEEGRERQEPSPEDLVLVEEEGEREPSAAPPVPPTRETETEENAFLTETIADLYLQQGLYDQAIDVFSRILSGDPGNRHIQERLQEALRRQEEEKAKPAPIEPGEEGSEEALAEGARLLEDLEVKREPIATPVTAEGESGKAASRGVAPAPAAEEEPSVPQGRRPISQRLYRWLDAIQQRRKMLEEQWASRSD